MRVFPPCALTALRLPLMILFMRVPRDPNPRLRGFARQMRHEATDAERRLWGILRGRRLADFKFRRQYPIAGYILDFYCVAARYGVELDGGQHNDPEALAYDRQRTQRLADMGVRLLRFWDHDVLQRPQEVAETIYHHLTEPSPQPSPGVPGEGEQRRTSAAVP